MMTIPPLKKSILIPVAQCPGHGTPKLPGSKGEEGYGKENNKCQKQQVVLLEKITNGLKRLVLQNLIMNTEQRYATTIAEITLLLMKHVLGIILIQVMLQYQESVMSQE